MSFIEILEERDLRCIYSDNTPYVDLLRKAHILSVSTAWHRSAFIKVYNVFNGLSPIITSFIAQSRHFTKLRLKLLKHKYN